MDECTKNILIAYVIGLIQRDGFDAIHTSNLIPAYRLGVTKTWSQFPHFEIDQLARLDACGVTYDRPSGWFRRKTR